MSCQGPSIKFQVDLSHSDIKMGDLEKEVGMSTLHTTILSIIITNSYSPFHIANIII